MSCPVTTMNAVSSHARKYGRSCLACRKRKVRCDAKKPECTQCLRTRDRCYYNDEGRNAELLAQLQHVQGQVQRLQKSVRSFPRNPDAETPPSDLPTPASGLTCDLSIDESGTANYYGATSRFHHRSYTDVPPAVQEAEQQYHRRWLKSHSRFQSSWETRAYERLGTDLAQPDIEAASAKLLIQIYWVWQAPLHNCVYHRCFFRDMATGGPYFSPFLLNVIFAHACRHTRKDDPVFSRYEKGEYFLRKAKVLLVDELETPKVPTIQALLILGGRQCGVGKNSEGWLYTSMAIAMVKDMGLHLPQSAGQRKKDLEPDDLEAHTRLHLSAYAWDKSISLCLGRAPQLKEMPYAPNCLLDDADDLEPWQPLYLVRPELHYAEQTLCYTTVTFSAFCQLTRLVDKLYATVYGNESWAVRSVYLLEKEIRQFYERLPAHLRFNHAAPDAFSPPPHILCLNVLYHTLLILLYRPFFQPEYSTNVDKELPAHARQVCAEEAALVNAHFQAYGRAFDYRNQTYLLSYCVYTAATIEVQLLQDQDAHIANAAVERLNTTLSMLEVEAEQSPGVRKSVDFIRSQIHSVSKQRAGERSRRSELSSPVTGGTALGSETEALRNTSSFELLSPVSRANGLGPVNDNQQEMLMTGFHGTDDVTLFDWNAFDISGGFPLYDEPTLPPPLSTWYQTE